VNAPGCTVHGRAGVTPSIESFFTLHWPCMNAVVCSESFSARLELKSAALTLMAVVLRTTELDALADELEQRASVMPGLFDDEPVAIDLACVRDAEQPLDFDALVALLRRHRMRPLAVRGGTPEQMAAAVAAGLLEAPEGARPQPREVPPPPEVIERVVEVQLAPLPPMVVDKPLRSGQQVYARDRDLIVLALVSHGAEVMADGHIHVYAPLRGRAHAGKAGNADARIFCHRMEAQVLAIADVHRTTDSGLPEGLMGGAAMVRLAHGELVVERLG
jgi:septum site-determining protein MinC